MVIKARNGVATRVVDNASDTIIDHDDNSDVSASSAVKVLKFNESIIAATESDRTVTKSVSLYCADAQPEADRARASHTCR